MNSPPSTFSCPCKRLWRDYEEKGEITTEHIQPVRKESPSVKPISHHWFPPMGIFMHIHQTTQTYQANERQITLSASNVEKKMRNWSSLVGRAICSPKIVLATPCQQRLQPSFVFVFLYMCRFVGIYNQVFSFASCVVVLGYGQSFGHRKFFCIL